MYGTVTDQSGAKKGHALDSQESQHANWTKPVRRVTLAPARAVKQREMHWLLYWEIPREWVHTGIFLSLDLLYNVVQMDPLVATELLLGVCRQKTVTLIALW